MTRFVKELAGSWRQRPRPWHSAVARPSPRKELVFGLQCDRTGPTATVGTVLCPGYHDYIALVNSKGGVEGYKIKVIEIDNEYKVPPAIEAHERFKKEGAVLEGLYGTPQTAALNKKLEEDKILGTSPGFGTAAAADGKRYPVHLPDRGQLLVAGAAPRSRSPRRSWAEPQGQEDRLSVLRQPGRQGAAADPRGSRQERGLRAAHLRGAGAGPRDGRADPRHHRPLQARLRHHPPVRPRAVGLDQGAEGQGLSRSARWSPSCGAAPRPTSSRPAAWAWPKATTPSSSPASARTSR